MVARCWYQPYQWIGLRKIYSDSKPWFLPSNIGVLVDFPLWPNMTNGPNSAGINPLPATEGGRGIPVPKVEDAGGFWIPAATDLPWPTPWESPNLSNLEVVLLDPMNLSAAFPVKNISCFPLPPARTKSDDRTKGVLLVNTTRGRWSVSTFLVGIPCGALLYPSFKGKGAGHLNLKSSRSSRLLRVFARRGQGTSGEAHASRSWMAAYSSCFTR